MTPEQQALLKRIVPGARPEVWKHPESISSFISNVEKQKNEYQACKNYTVPFFSESTVTALLDALSAAQEDADRLEWWIKHPDAAIVNSGAYGPYQVWFRYSNRVTDMFSTPRKAIDAARGGDTQ